MECSGSGRRGTGSKFCDSTDQIQIIVASGIRDSVTGTVAADGGRRQTGSFGQGFGSTVQLLDIFI